MDHSYFCCLSAFRNILEIDSERMIVRAEPLVNMGQISRASVPMNLSPVVVAELDDLTVGGLINGYGIEGSSHIYGLFSDTVVAYEIVLADGHVVRATKDNEYSDLFYAIPWSQGTLGLLVSAEIKLIPVKEYMRLTYKPVVGNLKELAQAYIDSFSPRDGDQDNPSKVPDFVETMIYNSTEGVMMTGRYASKEEAKKKGNVINNVGWWFKPWFYQHARTALKKGEFVEYIPTRENYHIHTRCLYWEGKLILPFADQWWFRFTGNLLLLLNVRSDEKILPTTYGVLKPPLGKLCLKIMEFIVVLLRTGNEAAEMELVSSGTIKRILNLFFEYPYNNVLHHHVESIIMSCLETKSDAMVDHLLQECDLIGNFLQTDINPLISGDNNKPTVPADGKQAPRAGNLGHITRISNKLVQLGNISSHIQTYLQVGGKLDVHCPMITRKQPF